MIGTYLCCATLLTAVFSGSSQVNASETRLVVVVMIDQFPASFLERFDASFGPDGFKRLQAEGAAFTDCHHRQAGTQTACGHAVLLTGRYPSSTGIVANYLWDRTANRRRPMVFDAEAHLLDAEGDGISASSLLGPHLADELKKASPQSKVISIAGKDRAAVLMGGHKADDIYWWDKATGRFITSTYYRSAYPEWMAKYNADRPADRFFGKYWKRLLPACDYANLRPDDFVAEGLLTGFGRVFPHKLGGEGQPDRAFYTDVLATPFGNELVVEAVWAAIEAEGLGADEATDLLAVGLSSNDYAGHSFGPQSHEIMDLTVRTDRLLGELLTKLDERVGLEHCLVVVSSDHGIAPLVEQAQGEGHTARRIPEAKLAEVTEAALRQEFGDVGSDYVAGWVDPFLYLNLEKLREKGVARNAAERVAAAALETIHGVELACGRSDVLGGGLPSGEIYDMVRRGFHAERSGDLAVVFKPYHTTYQEGTMHHGPHSYDTHVPLLLRGAGVKPGKYAEPTAPGDVAPTLARLLGLVLSDVSECRVLNEALK